MVTMPVNQCLVTMQILWARMCRRDHWYCGQIRWRRICVIFCSDKPEQHIEHITAIAKAIAEEVINYDELSHPIKRLAACGQVENDFLKGDDWADSLADEELYYQQESKVLIR